MKIKYVIFGVLTVFFVLLTNSSSQAVDTLDIDEVRSKAVLDSRDLEIIDNFVAQAVRELVKTKNFTSVARARAVILARKSSDIEGQAQYAEQFSESAYKHISMGLEQAEKLTPETRRFKVILNLLILVDNLEDVRLVNLARDKLNDENMVVQYWAVHSVTNAGIVEQLNSGGTANLKLASEITEQLKELVEGASPEVVALMAEFAAEVGVPGGEDLLLRIADVRISKYADWTVEYELLDATILKLLHNKISSSRLNKPAIARRFGQLYSYVMQRYIQDIKGGHFLGDAKREQLASVLVETEKSCISRILMPQATIRRAIERDDYVALLVEHNRLLGDETRAGRLALRLNFDYGRSNDGTKRTAPLALPERPKSESVNN